MFAETPGNSGGAVVVLPLRFLTIAGPTLPSRLFGAADDCRRLVTRFDALFEIRRTRPPFDRLAASGPAVVDCTDEFTLGFRARTESGSCVYGIWSSGPGPRAGSGEGWTELFVVTPGVSGPMFGDRFFGLEEMEEVLRAEGGIVEALGFWGATLVWTRIERGCLRDIVRDIVPGRMVGEPED